MTFGKGLKHDLLFFCFDTMAQIVNTSKYCWEHTWTLKTWLKHQWIILESLCEEFINRFKSTFIWLGECPWVREDKNPQNFQMYRKALPTQTRTNTATKILQSSCHPLLERIFQGPGAHDFERAILSPAINGIATFPWTCQSQVLQRAKELQLGQDKMDGSGWSWPGGGGNTRHFLTRSRWVARSKESKCCFFLRVPHPPKNIKIGLLQYFGACNLATCTPEN